MTVREEKVCRDTAAEGDGVGGADACVAEDKRRVRALRCSFFRFSIEISAFYGDNIRIIRDTSHFLASWAPSLLDDMRSIKVNVGAR